MELLNILSDGLHFLLHLNTYLDVWIKEYPNWIYGILFLIVFVETGLVIMPFLPGDSLLFAAGALAAKNPESFSITMVIPLLIIAALLGDNVNYFMGKKFGIKLFNLNLRFLKKEYLVKTEEFYEKHGTKTIIMARFVPIVRTFAPFVAGMGSMPYKKYIVNCVVGAFIWVFSISLLGYFFGSLPWVEKNFELVVLGIIGISILPMIIGFLKSKFATK